MRVRLLLDDFTTHGTVVPYLAMNSHPNIEVRMFNPTRARENPLRRGTEMLFRLFSTTRRMHNKAWIADARVAIIGGRNIGDDYFDASDGGNFSDLGGEPSMTTSKPLARYSAMARASLAACFHLLHHSKGHDPFRARQRRHSPA